VSQAATLELVDGGVRVKRQTEYGYDVIEAPLPCVVAVSDAINEPRYPSLKGIMGAKKKPQETLAAADLGIDLATLGETGSRTEVRELKPPPPRGASTIVEDEAGAADRVLEYLVEAKLV
jgi:electron transfer flavoprotein beta subunit